MDKVQFAECLVSYKVISIYRCSQCGRVVSYNAAKGKIFVVEAGAEVITHEYRGGELDMSSSIAVSRTSVRKKTRLSNE